MIFSLLLASLIGFVMVLIPFTLLCSLLPFGGLGENQNLMCLNNESWSQFHIVTNIYNSAGTIASAFKNGEISTIVDRFIKWNCDNHMGTILIVDGNCNGIPIRTGFGGIFHNNGGLFLSAFSGMISHSDDILLAELTAIYHGY